MQVVIPSEQREENLAKAIQERLLRVTVHSFSTQWQTACINSLAHTMGALLDILVDKGALSLQDIKEVIPYGNEIEHLSKLDTLCNRCMCAPLCLESNVRQPIELCHSFRSTHGWYTTKVSTCGEEIFTNVDEEGAVAFNPIESKRYMPLPRKGGLVTVTVNDILQIPITNYTRDGIFLIFNNIFNTIPKVVIVMKGIDYAHVKS